MKVMIPLELHEALTARAARKQVPLEDLIRQALLWYLQIDEDFLDELDDWQAVRDEASGLIEGTPQ
jgi:hypothetical protein